MTLKYCILTKKKKFMNIAPVVYVFFESFRNIKISFSQKAFERLLTTRQPINIEIFSLISFH